MSKHCKVYYLTMTTAALIAAMSMLTPAFSGGPAPEEKSSPSEGVTENLEGKVKSVDMVVCPETRPQICTREYRPVCSQTKDGRFKTDSTGCTACSDPEVVGYHDGECESTGRLDAFETREVIRAGEPVTSRTYVFTCSDNYEFVARIEGEASWLFLPAVTLKLQQDSDGAYRARDVVFRLNNQESSLEEAGGEHLGCRNNLRLAIWEEAKLNGADFRAIGNEPGWNLEILNQEKIVLVTGYGSERQEHELPSPETDATTRTTRYKVEHPGPEMTLTIVGEPCQDSMSGEAFESKVEVVFKGETLRGCGRALH